MNTHYINFTPAETTDHVAAAAREFAIKFIKPYVMEWDEKQVFPIDVFKALGELGMMGVLVPEAYGGSGLGYFEYNVIIQ